MNEMNETKINSYKSLTEKILDEMLKAIIAGCGMASKLFSFHLLLLFAILLQSCSSPEKSKDDILRLDIREANKEKKYLLASEVVSDIEYVALETSSECLIGELAHMTVSENYILVYSDPNCFLFSRKGMFIRKIGQKGNGPREYKGYFSYNVKIEEKSGMVYLISLEEICAYRLTGEFVKKLNLREKINKSPSLWNITHWKENLFCANFDLYSGKEPYRFIIFSLEGEIVKLFPNHFLFTEGRRYSDFRECSIYSFNEQLFFKELLCDTLFQISEQFDLIPEIIFDLPGKKLPENMRGDYNPREFFFIRKVYELENYMLLLGSVAFGYEYFLYVKNNNRLYSYEHEPLFLHEQIITSSVVVGSPTTSRTSRLYGMTNDIDAGLPIMPHISSQIQNNQQLVCVYQSYLLKEKLTDEHFKRINIKDQEAHQRLRNLLKDLDWEDNPVLMIATFK